MLCAPVLLPLLFISQRLCEQRQHHHLTGGSPGGYTLHVTLVLMLSSQQPYEACVIPSFSLCSILQPKKLRLRGVNQFGPSLTPVNVEVESGHGQSSNHLFYERR